MNKFRMLAVYMVCFLGAAVLAVYPLYRQYIIRKYGTSCRIALKVKSGKGKLVFGNYLVPDFNVKVRGECGHDRLGFLSLNPVSETGNVVEFGSCRKQPPETGLYMRVRGSEIFSRVSIKPPVKEVYLPPQWHIDESAIRRAAAEQHLLLKLKILNGDTSIEGVEIISE